MMMLRYLKSSTRRLIQFNREHSTYLHWKRKLAGDPIFVLSNIDRGLVQRPTSSTRTMEQRTASAQRVIDAYRRANADLKPQRSVYKVSNEWIPIYNEQLRPLLAALDKGDAAELRDLLDNFFRSSISQGLCGLAADMAGTFFERQPSHYMRMQMLIDSVCRYRLLEKLLPDTKASDLHVEDFGNPYGMYVGDQFLRTGVDYQYYYAKRVSNMLVTIDGHSIVAELGGGIGGFAYFLNKARPVDLTYINFDLPEILCISSYQLLNLFPEKRVLLYGELDKIDSSIISAYDIALLPSFVMESFASDSVDISFNSYSLAEMDRPSIENYATHLSRITHRAIMHVNHVSQALVGADSFSFDKTKFEVVDRTRALWNLGRNLQCDEYEFLLTRRPA